MRDLIVGNRAYFNDGSGWRLRAPLSNWSPLVGPRMSEMLDRIVTLEDRVASVTTMLGASDA